VPAIRAAAGAGGHLREVPASAGRTGAVDADSLARLSPAPGSVALTVSGIPQPPWQALGVADLLGRLAPSSSCS
jgi:hypothetical protein